MIFRPSAKRHLNCWRVRGTYWCRGLLAQASPSSSPRSPWRSARASHKRRRQACQSTTQQAEFPFHRLLGVVNPALAKDYPAPAKTDRKVFRTVFHQNSKNRDFISGITPAVNKVAGQPDFRIISGTLYRASQHAKGQQGAALLIIDEINRGPAVQVFGGAIVAIEPDKRLAPDGSKRDETQYFELLDPASGEIAEYALPHDLYILAAMNQADASVEPLDVAFLRRWEPLRLEPDAKVLRGFYGLPAANADPLPEAPTTPAHAFEAAARALGCRQ